MSVCCECCVLSGRGLCDRLITRPEKSYRMWRVVVYDQETSKTRRLKPATGLWKVQPQWVVTPGKQLSVISEGSLLNLTEVFHLRQVFRSWRFLFSHSGYSGPHSMWFVDKLEKNATRNIQRPLPHIYRLSKRAIITHFPSYYARCTRSTKKPLNKLGEANICVTLQPVTICLLTEYSSCLYRASTVLRHYFITPNWCTQL